MSFKSYFIKLAHYNRWANQRLYGAVRGLPKETYMADRDMFFKSIHGTLNHILVADRLWLFRVTGEGDKPHSLDQILYQDFDSLENARMAEDERIISLVRGYEETQFAKNLSYVNTKGSNLVDPYQMVFAHVFNHQTHHRGQVHGALSQLGQEPPAHVVFLFATTDPHKVLDTVLSRCQILRLQPLSEERIVARLEQVGLGSPELGAVDEREEGTCSDALPELGLNAARDSGRARRDLNEAGPVVIHLPVDDDGVRHRAFHDLTQDDSRLVHGGRRCELNAQGMLLTRSRVADGGGRIRRSTQVRELVFALMRARRDFGLALLDGGATMACDLGMADGAARLGNAMLCTPVAGNACLQDLGVADRAA